MARAREFERNPKLEELLRSLNDMLACSEEVALGRYSAGESHPVVFVMGPHRSGTTLFLQWLASTGVVAYPSNLLSRFYGAPVVGAQIQLLLTDPRFNFRNEILDFSSEIAFESENGKTRGALAPNEFWYFWRRFLPFDELDWLPDDELLRRADHGRLVAELVSLTRVFDMPFALKAMILNYNIPFLDAIFENALFVQIRRDPVANVASILDARRRQSGNPTDWYSFRIPEYPQLKGLDAVSQAAGQVRYINRAVDRGVEALDDSRRLTVQYEDFCADPRSVYVRLLEKLELAGRPYNGPTQFNPTRVNEVPDRRAIQDALERFGI